MDTKPKKNDETKVGPVTIASSVAEGPSSLAEQKAGIEAKAAEVVAALDPEKPKNPKAWYEIRLVRKPKGPLRRKVRLGPAFVLFDGKKQEPAKAGAEPDVASAAKVLYLDAETIAKLRKDADYAIRSVPAPVVAPNSLGSDIGSRTIMSEASTLTPAKEN